MACVRTALFVLLLLGTASADIGLICTLKGEQEQILNRLKIRDIVTKAKRDFYRGTLNGTKVVLVRSPMGKINNAITAQLLASSFPVDTIVSIGFAGGVDGQVKRGDVAVSTNAVQHDFGTVKPYGFIWEKSPEIGEPRELESRIWAEAKGYAFGTLASGDQFIASKEKSSWLKKKFNAVAVDTGSAAIYEVCKQNGIKCLFIRVISDAADIEGRINFNQSVQTGEYRSVAVLEEFLTHK
jgi:adenosylhomocysteine nucleosidase